MTLPTRSRTRYREGRAASQTPRRGNRARPGFRRSGRLGNVEWQEEGQGMIDPGMVARASTIMAALVIGATVMADDPVPLAEGPTSAKSPAPDGARGATPNGSGSEPAPAKPRDYRF